ncbi:MAG TPA: hypothetical protein VI337_03605 [Nitrospirales bacterium]|nr:hypothetical protein [Nitrospirales bacterium]
MPTRNPRKPAKNPYAQLTARLGPNELLGGLLDDLLLEPNTDQAIKHLRALRRRWRALRPATKPVGREQGRISINAEEAFALWAAVDVLGLRKADVLRHWVKRSTDKADYNWLDYRLKQIRKHIRQHPEVKAELIALLGDGDVSSKKAKLKALL